jgi:hypothetical protein
MILRRITQHLKQQQWTGVFIELVIVILGVFIGLQVQEWANARAEQHRADVLFQQVRGDLDNEKVSLEAFKAYLETVAAYARTAAQGLQSPDAVDPGTWVASVYQATQTFTSSSNRSTFDEMESTGAIDLIRNPRMRVLLVNYYAFRWADSDIATAKSPYRQLVRSVLPFKLQKAIKASCGDQVEFVHQLLIMRLPKTCHAGLAPADVARATASLRATRGLQADLNYQSSIIESKIEMIDQQQQQLDAVIAAARENP